MSHSTRETLRHVLLLGYDDLRARLTRRFGSVELASDALHETWLRLETAAPAATVLSPKHYVLQMAVNAALKSLKTENRFVGLTDAKMAIGLVDDAPDQERHSIARSDLEALAGAISELTPRRREILLLSRLKGMPLWAIAERLGISQRLVEIELKHALAFCALRLDRTVVKRFGPRPRKGSMAEGEDIG
jgi:RNA polymerase sigma-70 factor (ECF subfamily)